MNVYENIELIFEIDMIHRAVVVIQLIIIER